MILFMYNIKITFGNSNMRLGFFIMLVRSIPDPLGLVSRRYICF